MSGEFLCRADNSFWFGRLRTPRSPRAPMPRVRSQVAPGAGPVTAVRRRDRKRHYWLAQSLVLALSGTLGGVARCSYARADCLLRKICGTGPRVSVLLLEVRMSLPAQLGMPAAARPEQEVTAMMIDMTAQLAPLLWSWIVLVAAGGAAWLLAARSSRRPARPVATAPVGCCA